MAKWVTHARNGVQVEISPPSIGGNLVFKHGQIIENEAIATAYPTIFIEVKGESTDGPAVLTEVPAPIKLKPAPKPEVLNEIKEEEKAEKETETTETEVEKEVKPAFKKKKSAWGKKNKK